MTKTFTITEPVTPEHEPKTFEVEITLMHGDADAESKLTVKPFQAHETEALTSLITVLETMKTLYPNGRGGSWENFGFYDVEGFYSWFGDDGITNETEYLDAYGDYSDVSYETFQHHRNLATPERTTHWEQDYTYDEIEADLQEYAVYYYDANLIKHEVEIS